VKAKLQPIGQHHIHELRPLSSSDGRNRGHGMLHGTHPGRDCRAGKPQTRPPLLGDLRDREPLVRELLSAGFLARGLRMA
jgi:hypothetical protein